MRRVSRPCVGATVVGFAPETASFPSSSPFVPLVASAAMVEAERPRARRGRRGPVRAVRSDGGTTDDDRLAFGSGAQVAHGRLEGADAGEDLDATEALVREVLPTVAERDPETGDGIRTVRLPSDRSG